MESIYFSIDEAREEIKKRWNNVELRKSIENELGDKFLSNFRDKPRSVSFRQICSADNGFELFYYCAKYINADPLVLEYYDDIFVHFNEEKKGLGRLRIQLENGEFATVDLMNFHENEKRKLGDCVLKNGEKLIDFHRKLINISNLNVDFLENSSWFKNIGNAKEYYYYLLLHFVAHGIIFENLNEGDEIQKGFSNDIMLPEIDKIKEKYGLCPMIVRSFPDNQNFKEDLFWWCYPPSVNNYIIKYAKENGFLFKSIKFL